MGSGPDAQIGDLRRRRVAIQFKREIERSGCATLPPLLSSCPLSRLLAWGSPRSSPPENPRPPPHLGNRQHQQSVNSTNKYGRSHRRGPPAADDVEQAGVRSSAPFWAVEIRHRLHLLRVLLHRRLQLAPSFPLPRDPVSCPDRGRIRQSTDIYLVLPCQTFDRIGTGTVKATQVNALSGPAGLAIKYMRHLRSTCGSGRGWLVIWR